jgi:hypothetical protein
MLMCKKRNIQDHEPLQKKDKRPRQIKCAALGIYVRMSRPYAEVYIIVLYGCQPNPLLLFAQWSVCTAHQLDKWIWFIEREKPTHATTRDDSEFHH